MSPPERRPTIDDLLGHAPWVARLARSLVGAGGPWPDVVQETWLAAVHRPPESGRNLRGWLGRVITNAANQMRRSESRRRGREERAARG